MPPVFVWPILTFSCTFYVWFFVYYFAAPRFLRRCRVRPFRRRRADRVRVPVHSMPPDVQAQGQLEQSPEAGVRQGTAVPVQGVRQTVHVEAASEAAHGQRAQGVEHQHRVV